VDPFNLIIQPMATPVICCEETPPRWRIEGEWVCGHPKQGPCEGPLTMPVDLEEHRGDKAQEKQKELPPATGSIPHQEGRYSLSQQRTQVMGEHRPNYGNGWPPPEHGIQSIGTRSDYNMPSAVYISGTRMIVVWWHGQPSSSGKISAGCGCWELSETQHVNRCHGYGPGKAELPQ
jgi:hypothetical protein